MRCDGSFTHTHTHTETHHTAELSTHATIRAVAHRHACDALPNARIRDAKGRVQRELLRLRTSHGIMDGEYE